ncbi:hypothetical protein LZ30DRAFT_822496 [Colletotrichum cereale]|nr:hypothetical protein LZ30DRAFT_822496 [Colletotrichum cereale]
MSAALLDETQPCALVDANQTFIIGGRNIGFLGQVQTDFVMYVGDNYGAYLGLRIRLPRSDDHVASFFENNGGKSADLSITIRWPLDTFDISGGGLGDAQVETLIPKQQQANEFVLLQVKLRPDEKSLIDGIGLRDIFGQQSFCILVRNTIRHSLARFFELARNQTVDDAPYGNVHHWDVNRYKKQMAPDDLKRIQAPARFQFNGLNDASAVITQSIAQDCWWFALDVQELRKTKLPFLFIVIDDKPAVEADRFWAFTCLSSGFLKRFERSAKGFTAPHTDLSIATKMTRNVLPSFDGGPDSGFSEDNDVLKAILQEFFIGRGYRHPISQWHKLSSSGSVDTQLSQTAQDISLAEPLSSQKADPKPQFDVEVHASASTHKAVHNFADMLYKTGTQVVKALHEHANPDLPRHIPLVVRGYNIKKEVGSFIRLVIQDDIEWEMAKWSQQLSPCEWLLKLVNYDEFDLDPLDCPKLFHIRQSFRHDDEYAGLRAFVAGDIPLRKVRDYAAGGETSSGKSRGDDEYEGMTAQERRDSRLRAEHWARGLIQSLLEAIVESADVVCTTTHMSRDAPYSAFRESSKAVVLADAGTMSKAEAIVVWGPSFKPCAIGGDVAGKTRPFIDPHHMQGDKYANHFGPEATISVLRYMMGSGNAMFAIGSGNAMFAMGSGNAMFMAN